MKPTSEPQAEVLNYIKEYFDYDPLTGELFRYQKSYNTWKICAYISNQNYLVVRIKSKRYQGHYICWYLAKGEWSTKLLDHKDRRGSNNKLDNLRQSSNAENNSNKDSRISNIYFGVFKNKGSYCYQFRLKGIRYYKYGFKTSIEAAKARENHLDQLGDTFCVRNKDLE